MGCRPHAHLEKMWKSLTVWCRRTNYFLVYLVEMFCNLGSVPRKFEGKKRERKIIWKEKMKENKVTSNIFFYIYSLCKLNCS